jgi:tetratricopeptide (TPR) repeat protein
VSDGYLALSRSRHLIHLSRYDEALEALVPALGDPATEAEAWCLRTQALLGRRDLRSALESVRKAISIDPNNEWPHRLHALTLQRSGNHTDALAAAKEATRLAPDQVESLHVLAICQANARFQKDEAEKTARLLVGKHPHSALAHRTMGTIAAMRDNWTTAERHFRESLRLQPDDADAAAALAEALHRQGKREEAGQALLAAARSDPTDKQIRRSLGRLGLPALTFGGIGVFKVLVALQAFRAFRFVQPAVGTAICGVLLVAVGGYLSFARYSGTRSLPEHVHRGLMGDHLNYALGWLTVAAVACLPLALWAAAAPPEQGQSRSLAVGLLAFSAVALAAVFKYWSGPLPNLFPSTTAWWQRRKARRR